MRLFDSARGSLAFAGGAATEARVHGPMLEP